MIYMVKFYFIKKQNVNNKIKFTIKNLSNNKFLYLNAENITWNTSNYNEIKNNENYLFSLINLPDTTDYDYYLEEVPGQNNTYKIKYEFSDKIRYLACSKFDGMIVESDESNASEFIIIPYEKDFRNEIKFNKKINQLNRRSVNLLNSLMQTISDSEDFETINNSYISSCIKKELYSYIIFKIYYKKLNLIPKYEFNLETDYNNSNRINSILNNIDENIKIKKINNNIYVTKENVENYNNIFNNIFNIEDDLNKTLSNLFYLLDINDINENIKNINSVFSKEYFNNYTGNICSIGNDYKNNNNLCISLIKQDWLNDGPLHYFNSNKEIIDVCIFSKNNTFMTIKTEFVESTNYKINHNIKLYKNKIINNNKNILNNIYKTSI